MFTGCSSVSENSDYITKGEFFALFIEENNLYSDIYTEEDIENSDSYDIEAEIMLEWELIDENQKSKLGDATTKELVAQCCVRFMSFRQECSVEIKDIKKCHDQQAIIDAVGMGIFELENGYFDALHQMTYEDCLRAIEKTEEVSRNATFDNELEIEYQDDVEDFSGVEISGITFVEKSTDAAVEPMVAVDSTPKITTLAFNSNENMQLTTLSSANFSYVEVKIPKFEYNRAPQKYQKGKVFRYDPYDLSIKRNFLNDYRAFAGVIASVDPNAPGLDVIITIEQCSLDQIVKDTKGINEQSTTYAVAMPEDYKPEKSTDVKEGLDLNKTSSGKGVVASFKHTFTVTDPIYTNQTWRNAEASPSITIIATVDNFKINTKNLGKMLLGKKAAADISVTFDTKVEVEAVAGGLRYSPANNGNGKFWSNLSNARWTGASAGGSKMIKLGKADIPLGTSGFAISCWFYMYIQMDGSIHVTITQDNCYTCSIKSSGKVSVKNDSSNPKLDNAQLNCNISAGIQVNPDINFWSFKIVDAQAKAGVSLNALAGVYSKDDEPQVEDVYATQTELDEMTSEYSYCIHTSVSFDVSGQLLTTNSVIGKFVINTLKCKTPSIDESWELSSSHFEDGRYMSSCSRNNKGAVEVNDDGEILLGSYKEHLNEDDEVTVKITSVPINDKKISKYGGVTVKTENKKVATAKYDDETKTITIEAVGEGSTEITIKIKKGKKSKKYYTRKISVTVNESKVVPTSYSNSFDWNVVTDNTELFYC